MTASTEERLARLGGAYERLASQANEERFRGNLECAINAQIRILAGVQLLIGGVIVGILKLL